MIDFKNIEGVYFVGIGGIGMSALALYFRKGNYAVAGYDRSESAITRSLTEAGCSIVFSDDTDAIPDLFRKPERSIVVYTPAIPAESRILSFFRTNGFRIYKRSEILGEISHHTDTLAIAGTHGKTTVSTMTAHLLKQSSIDCSAFLGGISKNYESNLLLGDSRFTVMEADEFDRSFHRLSPYMAVVTSVDADHLDIYGTHEAMIDAYNEFIAKIRHGGNLFVNYRIKDKIKVPQGIRFFTYGTEQGADFRAEEIRQEKEYYSFSFHSPSLVIKDVHFPFPGKVNVENLTAAMSVAVTCGVTEKEIRKAALLFRGVRRRFDIRVNMPGITYIDDYAHHPEEIRACITSVKEYFGGRKITGVFQPHLFSRTQDHAEGFAQILDQLDEPILLPIYPAREKPIPGVTSEIILEKMKSPNKQLLTKQELLEKLDFGSLDVILTIGAGDIDTLVGPIEEKIRRVRS
ncbi:MAG TPA: UDP-N-acetylmuramate--L-alanine ligase [Bacteroidales bacterium]|nr:UDP-N-acetylmuramate--L-alanine ligase [Bacteroidales bacterium]